MNTISKILFILFNLIISLSHAQTEGKDTSNHSANKPSKYAQFLTRNEKTENWMFTAGLKYQYTIHSKSFSTNGYYLTGGINLARFFSRKIIFGVFVDYSLKHGVFYKDIKSDEFISDFNENFNTSYSSQEDSAVAGVFKGEVNNKTFGKSSYSNFGIMFSPFPNKYGGFLLSAKSGSSSHWIGPVYGNKFIGNGEQDNLYFDTKIYTLEITIKPFTFFRKSFADYWGGKLFILRNFSISFSYDRFIIKNSVVYNTKLSEMVNDKFMDQYGTTERYIITLGCTLY